MSPEGSHVVCDIQGVGIQVWKIPESPTRAEAWTGLSPSAAIKGYGQARRFPPFGVLADVLFWQACDLCFVGQHILVAPSFQQNRVRMFSAAADYAFVGEISSGEKVNCLIL